LPTNDAVLQDVGMVLSALLISANVASLAVLQSQSAPLLMKSPTVNQDTIVFQFAGDLWKVPRQGGDAVRLTTGIGTEAEPCFSPDGKTIAFTAQYDGNADVFTVPVEGGVPKRLTYHPGADIVTGWSPDGKSVTFSSMMLSNTDSPRLFTVGTDGGVPTALPFPSGTACSLSPDGTQIAYVPGFKWQDAWKRYRGGQAYAIWIGRMSDSKVYEIPRKGWNDEDPMWVGDKVYYLSDAKGIVGLYSYDIASRRVTEEVPGRGFDIKSASAGPGAIVYEQLGSLHLYDLQSKAASKVNVTIRGDFPDIRPSFKTVQGQLTGASLSPSGQRVAVTARGWAFTVPASKGDARLLSESQGVHRRDPAWSTDGKTIAYITDQNGRQQMALVDAQAGTEKLVDLGESPGYYYIPGPLPWSPDSTKITYTDHRNQIWVLDVGTGRNTKIDQTVYTDPTINLFARWSPDSKWLTYCRDLESHMQAIFVYSLESGKSTQITDGLAHAKTPIFDRDGKHLYFTASTNTGPALSWLDISSLTNAMTTSNVYCVVLRDDLPNPLHPQSDEEVGKPANPGQAQPPAPVPFRIDLDGIEQRIITLPMPNAAYVALEPGPAGTFFALAGQPKVNPLAGSPINTISKFSMADRQATPFGSGGGIATNPDGTKALLFGLGGISIVNTAVPSPPGTGAVDLSGLKVKIDPRAEWSSIFHEIWRNEPMLFYAANLHGVNAEEMRRRYEPFLANVMTRADLNYLFTDMLGEISIGHMWASGGDISGVPSVPGGLLGADFAFENGKYRLTRVYNGERWNPGLQAPLAQPGINAKAGEYILAIDGKELADSNDIYQMLEGKAGKQVKVSLGPRPDGTGSRVVTVVPVANELGLRSIAWVEDNRRYVEKMTNGRAGYVHVPDTGFGGWTSFQRNYYAQSDKDGIVVDERFNGGGFINDYMIYEMKKTMDAAFTPRTGRDWPTPGSTIYGPKVMIVNQFAGSGGDMFPWLFKHHKIGPVIGKRTWGGLVASFGFPTVDGGNINSPNCAFYNIHTGKWEVEGYGVDPDIDVELDPFLWRQGKDSQLERAIEEINKLLKNYKRKELQRPANPDKSKVGSNGF